MPYYIKGPYQIQSSGLMCDRHACINNKKRVGILKIIKIQIVTYFFTCTENTEVIMPNNGSHKETRSLLIG